jgi:pilus assembly protein CpaB
MDLRRFGVALLVAFVLSAGASYYLYRRVTTQNQAAKPTTIKLVAASTSLQAGAALTSESLTMIDWPANLPITGSFSKTDDVVGRSLIYPLTPKQPILERDLAVAGSGIGLTVKIPEGMRATALRSNDVVGVAGFLYPGSRVDVMLTYRPEGRNEPVTQTILQNVEVLTAGQRIEPDPQGKPENVNVVTLLLTPEDSQKIILASSQGSIQFVLRNGADKNTTQTKPLGIAEVTGGSKKAHEPAEPAIVTAKAVRLPKVTQSYVIETIAGGKRTAETF